MSFLFWLPCGGLRHRVRGQAPARGGHRRFTGQHDAAIRQPLAGTIRRRYSRSAALTAAFSLIFLDNVYL